MKKLNVGECSWYTCQNLFGCIVDTITMAISLPAHMYQQLRKILDSTPFHQNCISIKMTHGTGRAPVHGPGSTWRLRHIQSNEKVSLQPVRQSREVIRASESNPPELPLDEYHPSTRHHLIIQALTPFPHYHCQS